MPGPESRSVRSPLALAVLVVLYEAPTHPYRLHALLVSRGKDKVVNVRSRYSVQQVLDRLLRAELVRIDRTEQESGYPTRTVYAITEAGCDQMLTQLGALLSHPADEFPLFPAALSFAAALPPDQVIAALERRRDGLEADDREERAAYARAAEHLPGVFLIEDDYRNAMRSAEIAWIDRALQRLRSAEWDWDPDLLRER